MPVHDLEAQRHAPVDRVREQSFPAASRTLQSWAEAVGKVFNHTVGIVGGILLPRRGDASLPDGGHELASDRAEAESDVECRETHEDIVDFQGGFDDTQRPFHLAESRESLGNSKAHIG